MWISRLVSLFICGMSFLNADELSLHENIHQMMQYDAPPVEGLTDAIFPRVDPLVAGELYQMLKVLDRVLTKHKIHYWIDGGLLLGAVRHRGLIPWDDDGDIEILEKDWHKVLALDSEFQKYGYELCGISRLRPIDRDFPFIDILLTHIVNDKVVLIYGADLWPNNWFYKKEVLPGLRIPFGPIFLNAPLRPLRYLKAQYGKDCMVHAVCWQHSNGGFVSPFKVKIEDFNPAPYIMKSRIRQERP